MTLENDSTEASRENEVLGYMHPPKHSRFRKGAPSANPKGRPRKAKESLVEAMAERLDRMVPVPGTRRTRVSTLQLMIRNLVRQAVNEDVQAITEVVRLTKLNENDLAPGKPYWFVFTYENALPSTRPEEMTEEFFRQEEENAAEWTRELLTTGRSLRAIVESELSRKTTGERDGVKVTITMRDAVVAAMVRTAAKKPSQMKKLLKMLPEKKFELDLSRTQTLRPTAEELERYPAPGQTWGEWKDAGAVKAS